MDPHLISKTKINSKLIINLNVKPKTTEREDRKKTGKHYCDFGLDRDFLAMTPKAHSIKEQTNDLNSIKIKSFCSSKGNIKRIERQNTGKKYGKSHYLIAGLYPIETQ